jgi:hypothetical protein
LDLRDEKERYSVKDSLLVDLRCEAGGAEDLVRVLRSARMKNPPEEGGSF